ncbi:MAG: hypothetical protein GXO90_11330 [FCB group bacterium]|nr:hypothetical protein [FCB group bacterium]
MKNAFIILMLAGLMAQPEPVAYDWSGQYGYLVDRGGIVWNQDWSLGALILDGTFVHYPSRFGPTIATQLRPGNEEPVYRALDSTGVISRLINNRGDYFLDNLDISLEFASPKSRMEVVGYKRVYAGPYGQYVGPERGPLQQSYLVNYVGGLEKDTLLVTLGKFIGNSGLPDTGAGSGRLSDEIMAGGLTWIRRGNQSRLTTQVAPFFQRYRGNSSLAGGNFNYQLGQTVISQTWERDSVRWFSGLSWRWIRRGREISPGTLLTPEQWTVLGQIHRSKNIGLKLGASILDGTPALETRFRWKRSGDRVQQHIILDRELRPGIDFINHTSLAQTWTRFSYDISLIRKRAILRFGQHLLFVEGTVYRDAYQALFPNMLPGSWEQSGQVILNPFSWLSFDSQWKHYSLSSDLGPGYGDHFSESTETHVFLFQRKLDLNIHLRIDGFFNRNRTIQFNPVLAIPQRQTGIMFPVRDPLWITTIAVTARVSSVTITWSMNNAAMLFYGNSPDYTIRWYDGFQPLGRLSQFTIDWSFTN